MAEALTRHDQLMIALAVRRAAAISPDIERNEFDVVTLRQILPQVNRDNARLKSIADACDNLCLAHEGMVPFENPAFTQASRDVQNARFRLCLAVETYFERVAGDLLEVLMVGALRGVA